ncbi:glycosyltransferase family 32 protein [Runella aurantiaca]|uniref:Glycosyl transferase n=1 Tax=Runella aurantiaca TaxID=2282308 RepID=A0A369I5J8_9BACT|nr:glycosyltransferase [Runella aurantiaca]RDB04322.1 glycosyl transferase [Runella aurantiaca]
MIPKIIHYCWFGRGKMPEMAIRCIESWNIYLPDYELRLWNEDTFDINSVVYVKEAYEARKFAFVTDYVRLHALYHFGGIYMDTDVEVLKRLDDLLSYPAFSGFESEIEIPTGIMASAQNGAWAREMLAYYEGRNFQKKDGTLDMTTNVEIISGIMSANGFVLKNGYQVYKDCMHIFPKDYFCPKSRSGLITLTKNTYCIHHFEGSWQPMKYKMKKYFFQKIVGPIITDKLIRMKRFLIGARQNKSL